MIGHFYNKSIRKYVVLLTQLFSNIEVYRERGNIRVPITYASKERFIAKLNHMDTENKVARIETILPRISVYMTNMTYDATRKTNVSNRASQRAIGGIRPKLNTQFNAVPYDFEFEVGVYARNQDDMFQIIEQILPYFQPHFVCKIKELDTNEVVIDNRDIPILIEAVTPQEDYEGDAGERRRIEWIMQIRMKGWLYPATNEQFGEIRTIYINFQDEPKELLVITADRESVSSTLSINSEIRKSVSTSVGIEWNITA